jgi:hypothetical protein
MHDIPPTSVAKGDVSPSDFALQGTSWVEDFLTEFARGQWRGEAKQFLSYPRLIVKIATTRTQRNNKQITKAIKQTKLIVNKQS